MMRVAHCTWTVQIWSMLNTWFPSGIWDLGLCLAEVPPQSAPSENLGCLVSNEFPGGNTSHIITSLLGEISVLCESTGRTHRSPHPVSFRSFSFPFVDFALYSFSVISFSNVCSFMLSPVFLENHRNWEWSWGPPTHRAFPSEILT